MSETERQRTPLGDAIVTLRHRAGMNQRQLAEVSGVERSYISMLETGARRNASFEVLSALAAAVGVTAAELYRLETAHVLLHRAMTSGSAGLIWGHRLVQDAPETGRGTGLGGWIGVVFGREVVCEVGLRRIKGHAQIGVTLGRYTHANAAPICSALEQLGEALGR